MMAIFQKAASECADRDVNDRELIKALRYVRENIDKGPMLVEGFQKALLEPVPVTRSVSVNQYLEMIET